jgi:MFS family permease
MSIGLFLLFISVWLNYIDRGSLSVAVPKIGPELGLGPKEIGFLLSAFFWTYTCCQVAAGWIVDRYDVVKVYGLGLALWSLATVASGYAGGFAALFLCRMLLGIGESVAFPSYSKILTQAYPEDRRGFANALVDVGTKAGPALGTFVAGTLTVQHGWRAMFVILGVASTLWLLPWFFYAPSSKGFEKSRYTGPKMSAIVSLRPAQATFIGLLCYNYAFYFLLTWLPSYLVSERKFLHQMMSIYAALPFAVTAVASLVTGRLSDRIIGKGAEAVDVRRRVLVAGLLTSGICLPAATVSDDRISMAFLIVAFAGIGVTTSNLWALTMTLAGPGASQWTGVQNAVGNLRGVIAPIATGYIVDATKSFYFAFVAASIMLFVSAFFYGVVLRGQGPIEWADRRAVRT